ncbi:hypothetical protein BO94DRAFT_312016 [Aspergillus sclerotioniger CBS 115572]|uniref:Uncharacterized protein n=1 Tax=Aspergillus sclerotioniger CBS 115572 TaxID=1450535 RepID=A0A317X5J3_9EURO|nr:hypothetical protein BO94DRAFT_312016 [Aspergillus sclerotioniger CBS 115572]PWY93876.1 hypothetical protein BO94DRAFT_312016 [Aspergillus sclerotioniger CBS 115572]
MGVVGRNSIALNDNVNIAAWFTRRISECRLYLFMTVPVCFITCGILFGVGAGAMLSLHEIIYQLAAKMKDSLAQNSTETPTVQ